MHDMGSSAIYNRQKIGGKLQLFSFSKSDKLLIVAPHPDDESLGTGGLLQRAFGSQVPVRILFGTKGENNPWAQRFWERRWNIGPDERKDWGERRRQEALNAISALGGKPECAKFLNLPDQGITRLLMKGDSELLVRFAKEIEGWRPTLVVIPSILDAHPDHSALSVVLSAVLDSFGSGLMQTWEYLVHEPQVSVTCKRMTLYLSPKEVEGKKRAILCHKTQVALSRGRLTGFSKVEEAYYRHDPTWVAANDGPPLAVRGREEVLHLRISTDQRDRWGSQILLAFQSSATRLNCWRIPLSLWSGFAPILDARSGLRLHDATVRWCRSELAVAIPMFALPNFDALFIKLSGWTLFFDRSGWNRVQITSGPEAILTKQAKLASVMTFS
jgi:LmbE family N-acetylglucosaminyl deacetylase